MSSVVTANIGRREFGWVERSMYVHCTAERFMQSAKVRPLRRMVSWVLRKLAAEMSLKALSDWILGAFG